MKVEVRPLQKKTWHGKVGEESFKSAIVIEVLYDNKSGAYATGLNEEQTVEYSKKLGVDLSDTFNANEVHPYWGSKAGAIKLENVPMFFDTDNPRDFVKVANLKASKFVANSINKLPDWPDATHVIFSEDEEAKEKASKIQLRNKAAGIFTKLSTDEKINFIQLMGKKSLRGRSADFIDTELDAIIQKDPEGFLFYTKMEKEDFTIMATLHEAIHRNILIKQGNMITYMGDNIAADIEDGIKWFKDPQNSKLKASIYQKLSN